MRAQSAALEKWDELGELDAASGFDSDRWADSLDSYFDEYDAVSGPLIGVDADARSSAMLQITEETDYLYILGQAAARTVREEFEQTAAIEKLETIYDEARALGKKGE